MSIPDYKWFRIELGTIFISTADGGWSFSFMSSLFAVLVSRDFPNVEYREAENRIFISFWPRLPQKTGQMIYRFNWDRRWPVTQKREVIA